MAFDLFDVTAKVGRRSAVNPDRNEFPERRRLRKDDLPVLGRPGEHRSRLACLRDEDGVFASDEPIVDLLGDLEPQSS